MPSLVGSEMCIRDSLRYDYICADPSDEFLKELIQYHILSLIHI